MIALTASSRMVKTTSARSTPFQATSSTCSWISRIWARWSTLRWTHEDKSTIAVRLNKTDTMVAKQGIHIEYADSGKQMVEALTKAGSSIEDIALLDGSSHKPKSVVSGEVSNGDSTHFGIVRFQENLPLLVYIFPIPYLLVPY